MSIEMKDAGEVIVLIANATQQEEYRCHTAKDIYDVLRTTGLSLAEASIASAGRVITFQIVDGSKENHER